MGKVIDFESFRRRAEQSYQEDTVTAWHSFWKDVEVAYCHGEITEQEFLELCEAFSDDGFRRSVPIGGLDVFDGIEQHAKFVQGTMGSAGDAFAKARDDINIFTGEVFILRMGLSEGRIVASLYYEDWVLDSMICAVQVQPFEMEVSLCSLNVQKFCVRHKISSLLAKDVYESFLNGLELSCKAAGIMQITLKGDELYNDRWAEHHGYCEYGYSIEGLGLWTKYLG